MSRNVQKRTNDNSVSRVEVQQMQGYSGPLPHPEHFAQFEAILPGAADRILQMAEKQGSHRQRIEHREQTFGHIQEACGMFFAFLICVSAIGGSVVCILHERNISGTVLGGAGLTAIIGLLVAGRRANNKR